MERVRLDWTGASVKDGDLTVPLAGERPKGWKKTFETTVKLLGSGGWDGVQLKSGKVRVTGVQPGGEEKLRHFLDGVVQQASAAHQPDDADSDASGADEQAQASPDDPDAEQTARFRAFAD